MAQSDPPTDRDAVGSTVTYTASAAEAGSSTNGHTYAPGSHSGPVVDASFPELVGRLVNDGSDLLDKQIELAKQEIKEWIAQNLGAAKTMAIGAGIAAAAGLLLVIGLWIGVTLLLMWLFSLLFGLVGWQGVGNVVGWIVSLLIPAGAAFFAWKRFIQPGIGKIRKNPVPRTQATLKENLEWVRTLRTPSAR